MIFLRRPPSDQSLQGGTMCVVFFFLIQNSYGYELKLGRQTEFSVYLTC